MADEFEAVGTIVEGGLVAKAIDDEGNALRAEGDVAGNCLNCSTPVLGRYCGNCGQPLSVHRSIGALWHDILHGVLHFEGKLWRTIPLLAWKPGDLTRRYVRGQRARFISPMALFLFSIFMMFAVFSFMGGPFGSVNLPDGGYAEVVDTESARLEEEIVEKTDELETADPSQRAELDAAIEEAKRDRNVMATVTGKKLPYPDVGLGDGDFKVGDLDEGDLQKIGDSIVSGDIIQIEDGVSTGSKWWDDKLNSSFKKANANPGLLLYKLKANGYKFAWLLIPISVPFVWLMMVGRRGYRFYDHAVFATYSIAFMSLLFISCAMLAAIGAPTAIWVMMLIFYPPIHMYRQVRHAYNLSRVEALVRTLFLLIFTVISMVLFFLILLALGVLG